MQNLLHSVRRRLVTLARGLFCGRQTRICQWAILDTACQLLEPDGSGQGKRRVSLLYSDSMMLLCSSAYSRMFLKRYL
jgi:hypothetical protein